MEVNLQLSRREFVKAGGAMTAAATAATGGLAALWPTEAQLKELEHKGWSRHPLACTMCGAFCGLVAMKKDGEPVSEKTVRIYPNPDHPQRGYCGRAAATMWIWNHPLRIRKPLKRIGERGEGRFKEVTWDEALDEIGARLRAIVEKTGEESVVATSHSFTGLSKWLAFPLGSPNNISHSATCNAAGIGARDWVFGKGFGGAGKLEPDYAHLRYLLLIGRSMGSAMGALATMNAARENGAKVVSVDPRMPDVCYGDVEWVPVRPGTDMAFVLSVMEVMIREKLADFDFLAKHTNAAYLIRESGAPLTEADVKKGGAADRFALFDEKTAGLVFQGVKCDEKGNAVGFIESADTKPVLDYTGDVTLADGTVEKVETCFAHLAAITAHYAPQQAAKITGIPADKIVKIARDYATFKGCVDDGWYTSKNGNDIATYQLICILNAFNGNIDKKGGLVVTAGGGFKKPDVAAGKGPNGEKWEMSKAKRIDKIVTPETQGNFWVALEAMKTGKPYPVRAAFIVGTTMFHREANSARLAEALKALDLLVVQEVLPHEVVDYADFVLPATYYLERKETAGVKWALNGSVHTSNAGIRPPEGCEARHDIWIELEIVRRAFPERAERVGYKECRTADEFDAWFNRFDDKGVENFIKAQEAKKPGMGEKVRRDLAEKGWTTVNWKKYDVYPYVKPFGTPTGKVEIYGFKSFSKKGYDAIAPISGFVVPPAYSQPKADNEFILVSGKNCSVSSGLAMFSMTSKMLGDRTLWMNPADAAKLGIKDGETVHVTGVDNPYQADVKVSVTKRVIKGAVFTFSYQGGVRTKHLITDKRFDFVKEGINSHWFATGYAEPLNGSLANNSCIRITRIGG